MTKKVIETIISALVLGALTLVFNLFISYFFIEKGTVRIGEPVQIGQNQFQISISLVNTSNKNIDNLEIKLPLNVLTDDIFVSQPIIINKLNTNYGNHSGGVYQIPKIASHEKLTMIVSSPVRIESSQIVINNNGNNLEIEYLDKISSSFKKNIGLWIINALIYTVIFGLTSYISDNRRQKQDRELIESIEKSKKEIQDEKEWMNNRFDEYHNEKAILLEKTNRLEQQVQKVHDSHIKWKVIYQSRLRDYSKELNFWRDTIRKIVYKSSESKIESSDLINIVTKNLQTYHTKIDAEENFESLIIMSKIFTEES